MMKTVRLKKGREDSVLRFHPWIFSGAVDMVEGGPFEGETVRVLSHSGEFLAYGHFQIGSITVRILDFSKKYTPDNEGYMPLQFWEDRIGAAKHAREVLMLPSEETDCYRLVHGEGDSMPGLIVDIYGDVAVVQAHSAGMYLSLQLISEALRRCFGDSLKAVYNKSEGTAPFKAGLELKDAYLYGSIADSRQVVMENGDRFIVNWVEGQKTGFFLDQRDNRALVGKYSKGRRVLNLFCYTGGFSIYALAAGAESVVSVDSSAKAVTLVDENVALNFPSAEDASRHRSVCADAIDYLRDVPEGQFDLMVVDPPAFAKHRGALNNALRAYRRLNAAAISKVAPGGLVFTYSCSQVVDRTTFALTVFSAAAQVGRKVRILHRLSQPADHPVNIYHPEGEYLKGLLLYVE